MTQHLFREPQMLEMIDIPRSGHDNSDFTTQRAHINQQYNALSTEQKAKRARDIAKQLNLTEATWVAAGCGPIQSVRLAGSAQEILQKIGTLNRVMALTRNDACVHERHGQYLEINTRGHVGLVMGPEIDLRVFFVCWQDAFAVQERDRQSLQFFDSEGVAVHKIYCTDQTDTASYLKLVQEHATSPAFPHFKSIQKTVPDNSVDSPDEFRRAWLAMLDTHDFFPLIRRFNVSRLGALSCVGADLAQQVPVTAIQAVLLEAAQTDLEIMCFVGNRGMIQIHKGGVSNIATRGPWLNVLDPNFNLHLNMEAVSSAWVVNKPTEDGWVTSLEVFCRDGEMIAQFFGARKPGTPELSEWRALMLSMCAESLRDTASETIGAIGPSGVLHA